MGYEHQDIVMPTQPAAVTPESSRQGFSGGWRQMQCMNHTSVYKNWVDVQESPVGFLFS